MRELPFETPLTSSLARPSQVPVIVLCAFAAEATKNPVRMHPTASAIRAKGNLRISARFKCLPDFACLEVGVVLVGEAVEGIDLTVVSGERGLVRPAQ
jgi:hypothetical protein